MNFEDIKTECKYAVESISLAHSYLSELVPEIEKFIHNYEKSKNCDTMFLEEMENNRLYLQMFFEHIDSIFDDIEKMNITELQLPDINNVVNIFNYWMPDESYDKDIFVQPNESLNLFKPKLVLCKKDDACSNNHY